MNSMNSFYLVAIVSFSLSVVLLIISAMIAFRFDIPKVIGDLSGRTAQKSVERMRKFNEKSGNKPFKPSPINNSRVKLTEAMTDSKKLKKRSNTSNNLQTGNQGDTFNSLGQNNQKVLTDALGTDVLPKMKKSNGVLQDETDVLNKTASLFDSIPEPNEDTVLLSKSARETEQLSNLTELAGLETKVLGNGTQVISQNATSVLSEGTVTLGATGDLADHFPAAFNVLKDIVLIHTQEVIQ